MPTLPTFLTSICRLPRSNRKGEKAPHKPVLLLALTDWFEQNNGAGNRIPIDEELNRLFKLNWDLVARSINFKPNITDPLHFMRRDSFWDLKRPDNQSAEFEPRAIGSLAKAGIYGELQNGVAEFFQKPETKELIRMLLLDIYFPQTKQQYIDNRGLDKYILQIESEVIMGEAPQPKYGIQIKEWAEHEGYIRFHKFNLWVLAAYKKTCCISGYKVENAPIVEACHIRQHADAGINTIDNGIALCANLHRAFDSGLISLRDDYTVLISKKLKESGETYNIRPFKNKKINLPQDTRYYPNLEYLNWHREKWKF